MNLPADFTKTIIQTFGERGRRYLQELPDLLAEACRRWGLTLGKPYLLSFNYVCAATRADGTPAVLKVGVPHRELTSEIAALQHYYGRGACQLYEADAQGGMMLLERLEPGTMLCEQGDDEIQTTIAVGVMKRLRQPAPQGEPFISLKTWFDDLKRLRPRYNGGTGPFPRRLLETAEGLVQELFSEAAPPVLLHGDCHHFNILLSQRGWLVIDPKGVVGAAEYEPAPLLMNPWDQFVKVPDAVRMTARRIAILSEVLGFDRQRLHAWAVAHSVLSAWWDFDEGGRGGEYSIACGEIFMKAGEAWLHG